MAHTHLHLNLWLLFTCSFDLGHVFWTSLRLSFLLCKMAVLLLTSPGLRDGNVERVDFTASPEASAHTCQEPVVTGLF